MWPWNTIPRPIPCLASTALVLARQRPPVCFLVEDVDYYIEFCQGYCHPSCNGACWLYNNSSACQKLCSTSCGQSGCLDGSTIQCCPSTSNCLGGCAVDGSCKACATGFMLFAPVFFLPASFEFLTCTQDRFWNMCVDVPARFLHEWATSDDDMWCLHNFPK